MMQNQKEKKELDRKEQQIPQQRAEPLVYGERAFRIKITQEEEGQAEGEGSKYTGIQVHGQMARVFRCEL